MEILTRTFEEELREKMIQAPRMAALRPTATRLSDKNGRE